MSADPAQNGYTERQYKPGVSGNPGGRPRGLARVTREKVGGEGESIVAFWMDVMDGKVPDKTTIKDRLEASKLLAERGWGKPAQFQLIEDADPLETTHQEQDAAVERFAAEVVRLAERQGAAGAGPGNGAAGTPQS